jgi:hypothetical protein
MIGTTLPFPGTRRTFAPQTVSYYTSDDTVMALAIGMGRLSDLGETGRPQLRMPFMEHYIELTYNERMKRPLRAGRAERIE